MEGLEKCGTCRGLIDEEDLFCANCGAEAPHPTAGQNRAGTYVAHSFQCEGCGAQMTFSAQQGALHCPYCDSAKITQKPEQRVLAPQWVLPFQMNQQAAVDVMRKWLGQGFWRPGDLASAAQVNHMTPVYVPYWVFRASTFTYWTADSSQTPGWSRGKWYPMTGEHRDRHEGLLVPASGVLTIEETGAISPFPLAGSLPPPQVDLSWAAVEQFAVPRKYARPIARQGIEALEAKNCRGYVPGSCRNLKVNVVIEDMSSQAMLLPVWVMAYRYRDEVFRFLVNGVTGAATGKAPVSGLKIAIAILLAAAVVAAIVIWLILSQR